MKKSKILVPALAVLALGVAGASVGTVAWFQASGKLQFETPVAATQGISAETSALKLGTFELTSVVSEIDTENVSLTDTSGDSYVYLDSAGSQKVAAIPTHPYATISVELKVEYIKNEEAEEMPSPADIKNFWLSTIESNDVVIHATANGNGRFVDASSAAVDYDYKTGSEGVDLTVGNSALIALSFGEDGVCTQNAEAGDCYVAITGQEEVETASNVTVTLTPVNPGSAS